MAAERPAPGTAKRKPRGTPFRPGQSDNPSGRPPGSRSAVYAAFDELAAEAVPRVLQALIEKAEEGDPRAAEIIFRRAYPERKGRPLVFALPASSGAAGLVEAIGAITEAMAAGLMTPDEAAQVAGVLEVHRKAIALEDHEQRLRALEEGKP